MLQRLRKRLSSVSLRSGSRSASEKKEDKEADNEHDALRVPELNVTTSSPAASDAGTAPPSPLPALRLSTPSSSAASPSSPSSSNPPPSPSLAPSSPKAGRRPKPTPSPGSSAPPSPSIREYTWREQRLSSRAVPASIVHSYKPTPPKPHNATKLTSLPPELLLAVFAYLQGDPTRPANVAYRGASDDRDRWYSHDWSLMQAARTCRYLRAVAGPMLYARAALLHKADFVRVGRLSERVRGRIRHLTVSITALEELYVHLTVLALSTPSSPSPAAISLGAFPDMRLTSPNTSPFPSLAAATPIKKPYLRGTPFAPFFERTQLISLTLFRPRGASARSGDAVLPGFAEFFLNGVLGYWRALEGLYVRDERGVWPVLGDVGSTLDLDVTSMRTLEWDVALEPPSHLGDGLRALTLGEHVLLSLPAGLRRLKSRAGVPVADSVLPDSLATLHVLPPDGLAAPALRDLALPRLSALRDLRLALASPAALEALVLPAAGLHILQLHLPTLPSSTLTRILEPLTHLRILSLVLPAPLARTRAICETDSAHAAHRPLARALLESMCALREVHVGGGEAEACVWGWPSWISGNEAREGEGEEGEGDVVWRGVGERTLLE